MSFDQEAEWEELINVRRSRLKVLTITDLLSRDVVHQKDECRKGGYNSKAAI